MGSYVSASVSSDFTALYKSYFIAIIIIFALVGRYIGI